MIVKCYCSSASWVHCGNANSEFSLHCFLVQGSKDLQIYQVRYVKTQFQLGFDGSSSAGELRAACCLGRNMRVEEAKVQR